MRLIPLLVIVSPRPISAKVPISMSVFITLIASQIGCYTPETQRIYVVKGNFWSMYLVILHGMVHHIITLIFGYRRHFVFKVHNLFDRVFFRGSKVFID